VTESSTPAGNETQPEAHDARASESQRATITLLQRRGIEAEVLIPLIRRMEQELGRDEAHRIARETIEGIAREQGAAVAEALQRSDLEGFHDVKDTWSGAGGDLQIETLREDAEALDFNVVGCRFAEMYRRMGATDLGFILSCSRDFALSEGYSDDLHLERRQTIMQGAPFCDFRYRVTAAEPTAHAPLDEQTEDTAPSEDVAAVEPETPPPTAAAEPVAEPTDLERFEQKAVRVGGILGRMAKKIAERAKPEVERRVEQARAAAESAAPHIERAAQQAKDYVQTHDEQIKRVAETGARIAADRIVPPMLRPIVNAAEQELRRPAPPREDEAPDDTHDDDAKPSTPRA